MTKSQFWFFNLLFLSAPALFAQTVPDAGTLIRDQNRERNIQIRPNGTLPPSYLTAERMKNTQGPKILVNDFRISRAVLFPESELKNLLAEYVGKELSMSQLQDAATRISEHYRRNGYFARALLPEQDVRDNIVEIVILESSLGGVGFTQPHPLRAKTEMAEKLLLAQQQVGKPLRPDDVLRGLKLINETPGYTATATLQPGKNESETNLLIKLDDGPLFNGLAILDNQLVRSTGSYRLLGGVNLNNPSGWGDQVNVMGSWSDGSNFMRAAYLFPLGFNGARMGINATRLNYSLGGSFASLQAKGNANLYGTTLSYPLMNTSTVNLDVGASFDGKYFINDANGSNTSDKSLKSVTLSLTGDNVDSMGGGGQNRFGLSWVSGKADLAANPFDFNSDNSTSQVHGGFQKVTYNLNRLQKLNDSTGLFIGMTGQTATNNLDTAEKFSLGGPIAVRAYPIGEAAGDEGWLAVSELRYNYADDTQFTAFVDTGGIRLHKMTWSGWNTTNPGLRNSYALSGAGLGVNWARKSDFMLRGIFAVPLGNNPGRDLNGNDSDGTKKSARLWLQLIKPF